MVKSSDERVDDAFDVAEVGDPSRVDSDVALEVDGDSIGVSMESAAFMTLRHVRQQMRRLEAELLENLHHAIPTYLCVWSPSRQCVFSRQ